MNEMWIPAIAIMGSFLMVVAIVWLITRSKQRGAQYRAEVQMKMIERFSSSAEFVQFLESPAGRQFLESSRRSARDRVFGAIHAGTILTFLGAAFLVLGFMQHDSGFFVPALILGGLGIGFFVSSAISLKLAKQWDGTQAQPGSDISTVRS